MSADDAQTDRPESAEAEDREPESAKADEFGSVLAGLGELVDHVGHLVSAKVDLARARIRNALAAVVVGALSAVMALVTAVVSAVYLIRGAAGAFSAMADAPDWFGQLVVGLAGLSCVLGTVSIVIYRGRLERLRKRVKKYERRKAIRGARRGGHSGRRTRDAA